MINVVRYKCRDCENKSVVRFDKVLLEVNEQSIYFKCTSCSLPQTYPHLPDELFMSLFNSEFVDTIYRPFTVDLESKPTLPPLTLDDIIDFHFTLDSMSYLSTMVDNSVDNRDRRKSASL